MLELHSIHKSYGTGPGRLHVLKGIDLTIGQGEFVAIMGSSGSGKSTLMNVIGLMDDYDSGEYLLDGSLMKGLSERRAAIFRNRLLGFVFQSFNLIPFKTAAENVALPLYYQKVARRKRNEQAREYLDLVGLGDWADHLPAELSGGQQQRVAIARALVSKPRLVLADEPTGALDSETSLGVVELLRTINRTGVSIVIVTHERDVAAMAARVVHIKDGRVSGDVATRSDGASTERADV